MRSMKWVLFSLFVMAATSAFGQLTQLYCSYLDDGSAPPEPPLASPCWGANVFPDGTPVCLFWDNDANGPDADDPQPAIGSDSGEVNFNCFGMNGELLGLGAGYFAMTDAFVMEYLPAVNPIYYLQISANNTCYQTETFELAIGPAEVYFAQADWNCANNSCPTTETIPPPATDCHASDDTRCLLVVVDWAWTGDPNHLGGFTILADGEPVGGAGGSLRSIELPVNTDAVRQYTVVAYNSAGNAAPSNADAGSTYLMRWSQQTLTELTGYGWSGEDVVLHFDTPTLPSDCPSHFWIDLWYNVPANPTRFGRVASDSLDDTTNLHFPTESFMNCVLVLKDSNYTYGAVFYDTTGIFHLPLSLDDPRVLQPDQFALAQNYPNPFNPTTRIEFALPMEADVALEIFNIQGQLVRTLVDGRMGAGVHSLEWDGLSNGGTSVGAGVYLYRMVSGNFVQTRKMLLLK
ncbi:T9SS type A sorting domain-containing protein [candidate division KSB1 bacterium]|nr:T9SS type A sorting domain-containing protein [candidate division KSB1 bacterium]